MKITLAWKNVNTLPTTTDIFRSESPIDPVALPAIHATVQASAQKFIDDVEFGKLYYYRLRNTNSRGSTITGDIKVWGLPYTGPGPQELIGGDMSCGYFGKVSQLELISPAGLIAQMPDALKSLVPYQYTAWHKFAYKGKILYFPHGPLTGTPVSHATLYISGVLYGTDDFGAVQIGATPVNQRRTIKAGNHEFIVRQPRLNASPDKTWTVGDLPTSGEWHDLILRAIDYIAPYRQGNGIGLIPVHTTANDEVTGDKIYNRSIHFQESVVGQSGNFASLAHNGNSDGVAQITKPVAVYYSTGLYWRPVLELVAEPFVTV